MEADTLADAPRAAWLDFIARCALSRDTIMSRAFLRALGIPVPETFRRGEIVQWDRYAGMRECFANRNRVDLGDRG